MLCTQASIVKHGQNWNAAKVLYCRSWQCETCRPRRARQLVAQAIKGKPTKFLTLTVNPERGTDPVDRCRSLIKAWRALRLAIIKQFSPEGLPFLCVIEAQASGEPHLHIIARMPYVPQAWISAMMSKLIGAPIVDIRDVQSRRKLANYVAKYCGKDPQRFGTCKRYWQSKDWSLVPKEEKQRWKIGDPVSSRSACTVEEFERVEHCWSRKIFWDGKWVVSVYAHDPEFADRPCEHDGCRHDHHGHAWPTPSAAPPPGEPVPLPGFLDHDGF